MYSLLDSPDRFTLPGNSDPKKSQVLHMVTKKSPLFKTAVNISDYSNTSHFDAIQRLKIWIYTKVASMLYEDLAWVTDAWCI